MKNVLGVPSGKIGNPCNVPPTLDRVLPVRREIQGYSETAFFSSWNDEDGVGLLIHVGRCPQDVDLWYAQTLAYLPEGKIAIDRSWGRSRDADAIQTGNLDLRLEQAPGVWSCRFDGAAEIADAATMSSRPSGSGAARPMQWRFETEPAGPIWDLYAGRGHDRQDWAQGTHTQQMMRISGKLLVDGREYALDGVAGNDHSSGPRNLANFGSHHWFFAALPETTMHCISVYGMDGAPLIETGAIFSGGEEMTGAVMMSVPPLENLTENGAIEVQVKNASGDVERLRLEILHQLPLSLNREKDNINGVEWVGADLIVLTEAKVRVVRLRDGAIGYGHLERSTQRSRLQGMAPLSVA
jgi:hypothetical protein